MQKKHKIVLQHKMAEALREFLHDVISQTDAQDDDDKMWISNLDEFRVMLETKLINHNTKYTISVKPAIAFALRILANCYGNTASSYLGNKLQMIANEVHQKYYS